MSKAAVASLQRENDNLKEEIAALKQNFADLQKSLQLSEPPTTSNGAHSTPSSLDPETSTSLQFYSQSYDDLNQFRLNAKKEIEKLSSRLNLLEGQVEKVAISIEEIQRYSYQYNIKIIGLPESDMHESASTTTALCVSLFNAAGIDISSQDIDIAHRVPTRNAIPGPKPVICKFTRRIAKEQAMKGRKDACKVRAVDIGLPAESSMEGVKIFDHLTPKVQQLLVDVKKFQNRNGFMFCWSKNFIVYLRQSDTSRPIPIKSPQDLEAFAQQEGLPLS